MPGVKILCTGAVSYFEEVTSHRLLARIVQGPYHALSGRELVGINTLRQGRHERHRSQAAERLPISSQDTVCLGDDLTGVRREPAFGERPFEPNPFAVEKDALHRVGVIA